MKRTGFMLYLLFLVQITWGQMRVLNGRVLDLYLTQPIPGARVQAGDRVSLTDSAGHFSIPVGDSTLVSVSATAYNTRFYTIRAANSSLTVFLNPVNYGTNYLQVRGLNNGADLFHTPGSIASLGPRDFLRNNQVDLPQVFNLQPGVRMEFRSINTGARILIRGYGNQNNFNGVGYKAYYDDIPLTDADGTTLLDDIDFASLGRVEVFRGPVSSEYGTGIGGAVQFYSEKAPPGITLKQEILVGADALFRNTSTVSVGNETTNLSLHFGHQQTDGYRMNNASNKDFWSLNATFYSTPKRTISCLFYYSKSADQLPGQLDSSGLINYPDSADLSYLNNHSHSNLESVRIGITQEYRFNPLLSNRTSLFIGSQDQEQGVAALLTRTQKSDFGFRTSFLYTPRLGKKVTSRITVGAELMRNILYQQSFDLNNGTPTGQRSNLDLKPEAWNLFASMELTLSRNTLMYFGGGLHLITYDNTDLRTGNVVSLTGKKVFQPLITPRWVINHIISPHVSVYSNYSMGYAQPGMNQVIITQTGKVNEGLHPEISNTFEVGTKISLFKKASDLTFAFYNMEVSNKIVPQFFRAVGGQPAYTALVNAGSVNFSGAEISWQYAWQPRQRGWLSLLRPFVTYTYNGSRNSSLKSDNNNNAFTRDYSNLRVSGLPPNLLNTGLDIETAAGFYLYLTDMFTDKMPITLDNKAYADSYNLVNVKAGFRKNLGKPGHSRWLCDIFWGNNNLFNTRYAQFVVLNLVPFNGVAPRYFTPGPGSALYGGMRVRYTFR